MMTKGHRARTYILQINGLYVSATFGGVFQYSIYSVGRRRKMMEIITDWVVL